MAATDHSTVLVSVDVSRDAVPSGAELALLGAVDVVLLGYYPVPSQAAPAQLKHQHESDAADRLARVADALAPVVGDTTEVLVFTHDREETVDRVADEYDCDAVLTPGSVEGVERVLVPLRGDANLDRILALVGDLLRASEATVTLFHAPAEDADEGAGHSLLDTAADRLRADGIDADRIDQQVGDRSDASDAITDLAPEFDVLVLGETKPSLRERILGAIPTRTIEATDRPVFVVRQTDD